MYTVIKYDAKCMFVVFLNDITKTSMMIFWIDIMNKKFLLFLF